MATKTKVKKVTKSAKVAKPAKVAKVAKGNVEPSMKVASCEALASLLWSKVPAYRDTGLIRDLVNIKVDPASHGKAVIIWYGGKTDDRIELRVTLNFGVTCLSFAVPTDKRAMLEQEILGFLTMPNARKRVSVSLEMGSYRPQFTEILEVEQEKDSAPDTAMQTAAAVAAETVLEQGGSIDEMSEASAAAAEQVLEESAAG